MEGYDDISMEVETLHPLQRSKLSQGRHIQDEDGYLSDLSTLSNESLRGSSKCRLGDKAVLGGHAYSSPVVLKERIYVDQQQPRKEAYTLEDRQRVKADFFDTETGSETLISPMPKAPRPRYRSILEDSDGLSFPFLSDMELRHMSQSDEQFEQSGRPLPTPPTAPHSASPSVSPIITFPPEESPIARDTRPATHVRHRKHPRQASLPLLSPTQSPVLESMPSPPVTTAVLEVRRLHTTCQYGAEGNDGRSLRTETSKTEGKSVKNPLRRRRTCQREKEINDPGPVLLAQADIHTDDHFPSTLHNGDNKNISVLNPRRSSHDDIHALRSILKRARSPTHAPKMPSLPPLSAPVCGPSSALGPPVRIMSSPLPSLVTIPSSASLPSALNDQGQAEEQPTRQKSHAASPSFMSVPLGWFTNNGHMNASYSSAGTRSRQRASDGGSVQAPDGKTKTESADIGTTLTNTQNGTHRTIKSPGGGGHSKTVSSRSDQRNLHTTMLDLPFHFIALLTYPEPETGMDANDAQRTILESKISHQATTSTYLSLSFFLGFFVCFTDGSCGFSLEQERAFVRQRRRALMLLSCVIMTVRYCSFDFFLVILVATNCGLLYMMKRSGQHMDVTLAKRVVHRKLNLVQNWTTGLFRQGAVENEGYSKEAPPGVGTLGPGSGTMSYSNSTDDVQREPVAGSKQSRGRTNKSSRTDSVGSTAKSNHSYKTSPVLSVQTSRTPRLEELQLSQPQRKVKQDDMDTLLTTPSRSETPALAPSLISPGAVLKKRRFFGKAKSASTSSAVTVATSTTLPTVTANDMAQTPSDSNSPVGSSSNSPSSASL